MGGMGAGREQGERDRERGRRGGDARDNEGRPPPYPPPPPAPAAPALVPGERNGRAGEPARTRGTGAGREREGGGHARKSEGRSPPQPPPPPAPNAHARHLARAAAHQAAGPLRLQVGSDSGGAAPPSPARLLRLRSCGPGSGVRACGAAAPQIAAQRLLAPRRDPPYSAPLRWLPGSAFGSNSGGESGRRGGSASPASASAAGRRGGEGRAHCSSRAARSSRLLPGRLLRCRASQAAPARAPLPLHSVRLQRLRDQIGDRDVAPAPASATERKRPGPGLNNAGPGPGRSPAVCRANA